LSATVKNRDKADYLLDKGLNILWSKGYNGTSVNDIVSAADVPKGSFYFYFKSKEDFTVHALQRYFSLKRAATIEVLSHENIPAVERLFNYYNHRVTIVRDQLNCSLGCMGCNIGLEMAEHSESIRTTIVHEEQKTREIIVDVVKEAQIDGSIDKNIDAAKIVDFIEDAYKGMLTSMKENKCADPLNNFLYFLKTLILK